VMYPQNRSRAVKAIIRDPWSVFNIRRDCIPLHENDSAFLCQSIGVDGIPVVHHASEMLQADQRGCTLLVETAIGKADVVDILKRMRPPLDPATRGRSPR
jgi:hypothetical protein